MLLSALLGFSACAAPTPAEPTRLTVVGTSAVPQTTTAAPIHTTSQTSTTEAPRTTTSFTTPRTTFAAATTPAATSVQAVRYEDVEARFSVMTPEEKVGQLFCVSLSDSDTLTDTDEALLRDCHFGNIILFSANIRSAAQLAALTASLMDAVSADTGIPPFIAVDQEGGNVMRLLDAAAAPPAMAVGSTGDPGLAWRLGELMGAQLRTLGINVDFAPVADVNSNPDNPVIGARSYSEDPAAAAAFVSSFTQGLQSSGVLACIKHFPGHGDTDLDSHTDLPEVTKDRASLEKTELVPFRAGIAAGAAMTMVGHILYPALGAEDVPASLSEAVIEGVLRDELGFSGLVVTDSLSMGAVTDTWGEAEACVMAVNAGADLLCVNDSADALRTDYEAVLQAVMDGRIRTERLDQAVLRILSAKYEYNVLGGARPSARLPDTEAYASLLETIARESLTVTDGTVDLSGGSGSTLVLFNKPARTALNRETQSFGAYMARTYGLDASPVERRPAARQISSLLTVVRRYDTVILAVSGTDCAGLAEAIAGTGVRVCVVLLDSVYRAPAYKNVGAEGVLCAWEYTDYSVRAAAARLLGPSA